MTLLTIITLVSTLLLGFIFFLFFCWGVKDGQFSNIEEAKYEMFREPSDMSERHDSVRVKDKNMRSTQSNPTRTKSTLLDDGVKESRS